ncbi:MAG: hypothetical protein ACOCWQ_03725 [Nanoarchaeota archaeon]
MPSDDLTTLRKPYKYGNASASVIIMADDTTQNQAEATEKMSKEEQIGFHKGSISVLAKEREELARIVNIVEQLMQMHTKALGDLGVDISQLQAAGDDKDQPQKRVPIENLI